ncbi:hypothetical protein GCM10022254_24610 [Actinomadura meridiana]|uniref:Uncharacterized protein n=1 Tax=Actinomadura meridiana TaxID=559626 RepID=A0ABP8BYS1_9ACTN
MTEAMRRRWSSPAEKRAQELRHGWRLDDINALAVSVVKRDKWWVYRLSFDDRLEIAWAAMAEKVCLSDSRPSTVDLCHAARDAIQKQVLEREKAHGTWHFHDANTTNPGRNFHRYWWRRRDSDFAEEIVQGIAAQQILEVLTPRQRSVVEALKDADGDVHAAADTLELSLAYFREVLHDARVAFLECWHDGETPSRIWMQDGGNSAPIEVMKVLRRRKRKQIRAAATETGAAE